MNAHTPSTHMTAARPTVPSYALTDEQIAAMRTRRVGGECVGKIASDFGVSRQVCDRIVRGAIRADAPGPIYRPKHGRGAIGRRALLACAVVERRAGGPWRLSVAAALMEVGDKTARDRVARLEIRRLVEKVPDEVGVFRLSRAGWRAVAAVVRHTEKADMPRYEVDLIVESKRRVRVFARDEQAAKEAAEEMVSGWQEVTTCEATDAMRIER